MSSSDMDMMMDSASMTRDQVNSLVIPRTTMPLKQEWWQALLMQIQQMFARIQQQLAGIEMRTDATLSMVERSILANPNLTMAEKQEVMNRVDRAQMRVDQRFDIARTRINTSMQEGIEELMMQEQRVSMMPSPHFNRMLPMVDLGGGDMVGMRQAGLDVFGRKIMKHNPIGFTPMVPRRMMQRPIPPLPIRRPMIRRPGPGQNIFSNTM